VTYDQLGQYESPASDSEADYSLDLLAADLIDIAGSLTGPLHVVGHSFGGLVVATAVIKRPEIFASVTVLACGLGRLSEPLASETAPFLLIPDETPAATVWQLRREIEGPLDPNLPPEVAAFVERKFVASPVVAMKAKLRALLTAPDLSAALAATARPFLVATGATDDYWALDRQRAVAAALGTELVLFAGCGHSPAVDDPAQVAAEFDQFWTSSHS
jgi:pimeloyl-ACP methyl ester carboxylesterase